MSASGIITLIAASTASILLAVVSVEDHLGPLGRRALRDVFPVALALVYTTLMLSAFFALVES